jgi:spermidine synthase
MEAPLQRRRILLHFLEPPDCSRSSLLERLYDGTYDKPFIIDRGLLRFLHFDLFAVQSAMNLRHPHRLSLAYTRKMMTFLLFNPTPARILLLGLGGGSLAKFCYRSLPDAKITAVEVNPHVIALRKAFHIPGDDERFQVVCEEGAAYVARRGMSKDIILADACDSDGVSTRCNTLEFYHHIHRRLSAGGVFVSNLCVDTYDNSEQIRKICAVFGSTCVTLQVKQDGNVIVLAFKAPGPSVRWPQIEAAALCLKRQFGLDFPRYVRLAQQQR